MRWIIHTHMNLKHTLEREQSNPNHGGLQWQNPRLQVPRPLHCSSVVQGADKSGEHSTGGAWEPCGPRINLGGRGSYGAHQCQPCDGGVEVRQIC